MIPPSAPCLRQAVCGLKRSPEHHAVQGEAARRVCKRGYQRCIEGVLDEFDFFDAGLEERWPTTSNLALAFSSFFSFEQSRGPPLESWCCLAALRPAGGDQRPREVRVLTSNKDKGCPSPLRRCPPRPVCRSKFVWMIRNPFFFRNRRAISSPCLPRSRFSSHFHRRGAKDAENRFSIWR